MKAYKYEVSVCEGGLALSHGFVEKIREIWIPELGIIFNEKFGAFKSKEPRNQVYPDGFVSAINTQTIESSMEEIDLNEIDASLISAHAGLAEPVKETIKRIFDLEDEDR
jgi:hypothetical protein